MANNTSFRSSWYIWAVRILQLIFAVTLLGIAASDASLWSNIGCSTPSKLAYHIAMAAITLLPVAYFLLCTGPVGLTKFWSPWVQIAIDALFLIFWIVAAALSTYDCDGICSSCSSAGASVDDGYGFYVAAGSLICVCVFPNDYDYPYASSKLFRRVAPGTIYGRSSITKTAEQAWSIATRKGLDATMIFLFFKTLLVAILLKYVFSASRTKAGANNTAAPEEAHVGDNIDMSKTVVDTQKDNTQYTETQYIDPRYGNTQFDNTGKK